ncbi:MAG: hypothetical protein HQ528_02815 [Candidatus Marinimicrobia bacterium]|nr:hypothetical protein [Candidatus Neomarinimicrobiota bacterium]
MKTYIAAFPIIIALIFGSVTPLFSQNPELLFQQGLVKEEGEGSLYEAIELYIKIVDNQDADKSIKAKALLHVGLCYEKLGRTEATKAYQNLVDNFPGQKNEVAIARERLSLLLSAVQATAIPKSVTLQKVWSGGVTIGWGAISPDGQFITYSDSETDNLAIRELSNGKTSILTKEAGEDPLQFNMGSTVSPNSKQVAYAWYKNNHEIRLIEVDDPHPKVLYGNEDEDVYPCAWSPDGKIIYARSLFNKINQGRILAITVASGEIQILKTFNDAYWYQLSVSPDNQFIAYNVRNYKDSKISDTDINLISTDGKNETSLIKHPANDYLLGWFPDKNQILFKSDRSGTWDAWTVSVINGEAFGEPWRVLTEIGENASQMGFTENGTFYYSLISRKFNTFTAPLDQVKGELKSDLAKPLLGSIGHALWSPDGKSLALIKEQWAINRYPLFIRDLETGKERKLPDWLNVRHLRWSSDGKTLLVAGYDDRRELEKDNNGGIYTIEVESGKVTELLAFSNTQENDGEKSLVWAQTIAKWSDDQKSIYYLKNNQLINRKLITGQEKILSQNKKISKILGLSPDGKNLIVSAEDQIYITSTTGGKLISIVEVNTTTTGPSLRNKAVWSPNENYIFFTKNRDGGSVLWRINAEGKNPKEVWRSKVPISSLSIHPDGQKIVITTLNQESEIWKVDNLLSIEETNNN